MATKKPTDSTAIVTTQSIAVAALERKLGFTVERVEKRTALEDADTQGEQRFLDLLLKDGFKDPASEFQALFAQFGLTAYADKAALHADQTRFRISRVLTRIEGGYDGEDDWGLAIITEHGEPQMLTFGSNPGRDRFMTMMAYYISIRGITDFCRLTRYEKQNEQFFYVIDIARENGPTMRTVRELAENGDVIEQAVDA